MGLNASERRAVGEPIVLATEPDPLAHMNTREHTLAQQFIQILTSAGRNAEGSSAAKVVAAPVWEGGGGGEEEGRRGGGKCSWELGRTRPTSRKRFRPDEWVG